VCWRWARAPARSYAIAPFTPTSLPSTCPRACWSAPGAASLGVAARLELADVQALPFPDASFDAAVATFVVCSVSDPVLVLREVRRLLKPGGRLLLLEHVVSQWPVLRSLMQWLDPLPHHLWGAQLNRETVETAGFAVISAETLSLDVVKHIAVRAPDGAEDDAGTGRT